mmetsp:Transcript_23872/g.33394  ORF Transcript_23872/g.33394 Transcript_23872/m.33394 type:complete len:123 (+) Transcript_23872:63-431(+)
MPASKKRAAEVIAARTIKRKKKKKGKKRAPGAFIIYSNSIREDIKVEFPELKFTEIGKKIGEKWRALTEDERNVWKKKSEEIKKKIQAEQEAEEMEAKQRMEEAANGFSRDVEHDLGLPELT